MPLFGLEAADPVGVLGISVDWSMANTRRPLILPQPRFDDGEWAKLSIKFATKLSSNKSSNPSPSDTRVLVARYRSRTSFNYTSLPRVWIAANYFLNPVSQPPILWTGRTKDEPINSSLRICKDSRLCVPKNIGWKWRLFTVVSNVVDRRDNTLSIQVHSASRTNLQQTGLQFPSCATNHFVQPQLSHPATTERGTIELQDPPLLLPAYLNTLASTVLKEVADDAGVDAKGIGFIARYLHQTCILRPQGLKLKYEDASSTAIRLIVANIMATALSSTSQFHMFDSIPAGSASDKHTHCYHIHLVHSRYFFPGYDHDDYASTHCASDDDSGIWQESKERCSCTNCPAPRHPLLSVPKFWGTASASPHSTHPNRERVYVPSRDTRVLNAMRGQRSNPSAPTET
ncbi:hypothetical protein CPC08DRAFT_725880 [Agrocybe pediades]|nr:hypothetical protein CPC08DRAFT_725880 [Agrocybe pediades]